VRWSWEAGAPVPAVELDRIQMEQAFVNVIKNALEAIGRDGTITIRLGTRGPRPFVAIEDSGPGLPPEARANLFTPFFTTKENGQGLGLTLVREILDKAIACDEITAKLQDGPNTLEEYDQITQ